MTNKKRILITQNSLRAIGGGELTVYELADFLQNEGHEVTVYTWYLGGHMKDIVSDAGIKVVTPINSQGVRLSDFDLIWVFNQVLPEEMILDLTKIHKKYPKFIFTHLSVLDSSPIDHPYIHDLENKLSALSLFRAEDALNRYAHKYLDRDTIPAITTYNNPAPVGFSQIDRQERNLRRILIVVSNPANNIDEISNELAKRGYIVDVADKNSVKPRLISPKQIRLYDLVISSAKTAQYCLCSGTPIYIMDMFGVLGYLNADNFDKAKRYNFSGNVQNIDDPEYLPPVELNNKELVNDIVNGYDSAQSFQLKNREKYIEEFSIATMVPRIFEDIKDRKISPFQPSYSNYVQLAMSMTRKFITEVSGIYPERIATVEKRLSLELKELEKERRESNRLRAIEDDLRNKMDNDGIKNAIKLLIRSIRRRL